MKQIAVLQEQRLRKKWISWKQSEFSTKTAYLVWWLLSYTEYIQSKVNLEPHQYNFYEEQHEVKLNCFLPSCKQFKGAILPFIKFKYINFYNE